MSDLPMVSRIMSDSSLEISKNSRGFTYSVKAYGQTVEEIDKKINLLIGNAEEYIKDLGDANP